MEDTSGFYKLDATLGWITGNEIYGPTYVLKRELKDTYEYPVDGWEWHDVAPIEYTKWLNNEN